VQLVAKLHDTSASQIEKHYAATIASHTDELVRIRHSTAQAAALGRESSPFITVPEPLH
jgi:hypothetical protein